MTVVNAEAQEPCQVDQSRAAKLVFVRLGELLLHVTAFRNRPKEERNPVQCPACHAPVTIRHGERRVPHAAHRPGTGEGCPATNGESALHMNMKVALGLALQALSDRAVTAGRLPQIEIALACLAEPECRLPAWRPWTVTWDSVEIECRVGVHRPDLVLSLKGTQVGAIEVLVSHEVSPEKASALRLLGVSWLEVLASEVAAAGGQQLSWSSSVPLPVYRASQENAQDNCPKHDAERQLKAVWERYRALKRSDDPAVQVIERHGRQLRAVELEISSLLGQAAAVTNETNVEIERLAALGEELPERIGAAEARLERAKEFLANAQRLAASQVVTAQGRYSASGRSGWPSSTRNSNATSASVDRSQPTTMTVRCLAISEVIRVGHCFGEPSTSIGCIRILDDTLRHAVSFISTA